MATILNPQRYAVFDGSDVHPRVQEEVEKARPIRMRSDIAKSRHLQGRGAAVVVGSPKSSYRRGENGRMGWHVLVGGRWVPEPEKKVGSTKVFEPFFVATGKRKGSP